MTILTSPSEPRLAFAAPLPPLVRGWVEGRGRQHLAPLSWVAEGELPPPAPPMAGRQELAAALARTNASYGHPAADELAARLADPATQVVVTGQQPGLFGGPLYTLLKAVAAVLWAERLEAAGRPAVAVFWMATEDHDFAEVAGAGFWNGREVVTVGLGERETHLAPVGTLTLGAEVSAALATLAETFPYQPFAGWVESLGRWYRPEARFGEAMARLLADLLGPRCPLILDALLPELKRRERPSLRRLVERRREVAAALATAEEGLTTAGFALQVAPQENAAPLSVLRAGRRRVLWAGEDRYRLRGLDGEWPVAELLETIDDNPAAVSPNVLARPAVQDAALGTALQVLGPGELAYMAQAAPVWELLEVTPPAVALRPQALLLEERQRRVLADSGLPPELLVADREEVDRHLAAGQADDLVGPARQRATAALDDLREAALALDPNLERPWEKTREHVLRGFDTFADKVTRAAAQRDQVARQRLSRLRAYGAPGGTLHERVLSLAHFRGRYGPQLVERLFAELRHAPGQVQVIDPGDGGEEP